MSLVTLTHFSLHAIGHSTFQVTIFQQRDHSGYLIGMMRLLLLAISVEAIKGFTFSAKVTRGTKLHGKQEKKIRISGQGFGKNPPPNKTYEPEAIISTMTVEESMESFFEKRQEWMPIFGDLATSNCMATPHLSSPELVFESTSPWQRLPAIPEDERSKTHLAVFLDSMQQSYDLFGWPHL